MRSCYDDACDAIHQHDMKDIHRSSIAGHQSIVDARVSWSHHHIQFPCQQSARDVALLLLISSRAVRRVCCVVVIHHITDIIARSSATRERVVAADARQHNVSSTHM